MTLMEETVRKHPELDVDRLTGRLVRVCFAVPGEAKPAGSKRAFINRKTGVPIITDSTGKAGKTWRQDVQLMAREAMKGYSPLDGPLVVALVFYRVRPKGHYGTGKNADRLKDSAPRYPTTRPDVLKLARAVEDALTGIVYTDDSLIVTEYLLKRYSDTPRVEIDVRPA